MRAQWAIVCVLAAGGAWLPGCGGDDDGGGTEAPAAKLPISETDFRLDPSRVDLDEPGRVRFQVTNDGKTVHALEVEGPEGEVETESIQPGKSATLTVELGEDGEFVMYCPVGNHRELGMEGNVVVGGGGGSGSNEEESGGGGGY
jgi:plastocyanin